MIIDTFVQRLGDAAAAGVYKMTEALLLHAPSAIATCAFPVKMTSDTLQEELIMCAISHESIACSIFRLALPNFSVSLYTISPSSSFLFATAMRRLAVGWSGSWTPTSIAF